MGALSITGLPGIKEQVAGGHQVVMEGDAGRGSSIFDDPVAAGAKIVDTADDVSAEAHLVLKVKEPVPEKYPLLRSGQVLFTYLHLAASRECTDAIVRSGITTVAYETVQLGDGSTYALQHIGPYLGIPPGKPPRLHPQHSRSIGAVRGRAASTMRISITNLYGCTVFKLRVRPALRCASM